MSRLTEFYKRNWADIFKPVGVLLCICVLIPLALAVTNHVTKDKIAALSEQKRNEAMRRLVEADSFAEKSGKLDSQEFKYYAAERGGQTEAYLFITREKGYGGEIEVMTAVGSDGTVMAAEVLDVSEETPGLGQNTAKNSFYSQYAGLSPQVSVVKNNADREKNEINAVTGATISSKAVTRAVNRALAQFQAVEETGDAQ